VVLPANVFARVSDPTAQSIPPVSPEQLEEIERDAKSEPNPRECPSCGGVAGLHFARCEAMDAFMREYCGIPPKAKGEP
jgi:hypothetical protein